MSSQSTWIDYNGRYSQILYYIWNKTNVKLYWTNRKHQILQLLTCLCCYKLKSITLIFECNSMIISYRLSFQWIHETVCRNSDDILSFSVICLSSRDLGAEIRYIPGSSSIATEQHLDNQITFLFVYPCINKFWAKMHKG